jgi:hypothetical protein
MDGARAAGSRQVIRGNVVFVHEFEIVRPKWPAALVASHSQDASHPDQKTARPIDNTIPYQ